MREFWVERRKWPDAPHYAHEAWVLGEDEHGLWLELRVGSPIYRGEDVLFHGRSGGLMLVPPTDGWLAWFPEFGDFDLYVDIVCHTERTESSVTMVDLDLDVIRRRDGSIELLDEDEFAVHQVELGYPADVIDHARRTGDSVLAAVRAGEAPFGGPAARAWSARRSGRAATSSRTWSAFMGPVVIEDAFADLPFRDDREVGLLNGHPLIARRIDGPKRAPGWEMHPDTDEFFQVVEGHMQVTVMTADGPSVVDLPAGSIYVIPRGHWHQPATLEPSALLFLTPGKSEWTDEEVPPGPEL